MKTDLYTKIVLTVIAVCLTVSLLKEFEIIPSAKASTATAPSPMLTGTQAAPVDVNIVQYNGNGFAGYYGLPVEIRRNDDK